MTLIEAIKSGKKFKRGNSHWVEPEEAQFWFRAIDYSALIADDWEIEEQTVSVSLSDFNKARERAVQTMWTKKDTDHSIKMVDLVAKELGLCT